MKLFLIVSAILVPLAGIGFVIRNIVKSNKKKVWLWLKSLIVTASLLFLGFILMVSGLLYLPPYKPGTNLHLVRDTFGDEIIEIYTLMCQYAEEQGALYETKQIHEKNAGDWNTIVYEKMKAMVHQIKTLEGAGISLTDLSFSTSVKGQCSIELAVDSHAGYLVYLIYNPSGYPSDSACKPLDEQLGWYYWCSGD